MVKKSSHLVKTNYRNPVYSAQVVLQYNHTEKMHVGGKVCVYPHHFGNLISKTGKSRIGTKKESQNK